MSFLGRFTSFRHVGVFPEQDAHWRSMEEQIIKAARPIKLLNLFGYTGVASLIGARAGANVTHVDASKRPLRGQKLIRKEQDYQIILFAGFVMMLSNLSSENSVAKEL